MYLSRLIYLSNTPALQEPGAIEDILNKSKSNNKKNDITGILVFSGDYFLQVLEGGRTSVSQTFSNIAKDPRHENLVLIDFSAIDERMFGRWSMGYIADSQLNRDIFIRFSPHGVFEPEKMTSASIEKMLAALASELDIQDD